MRKPRTESERRQFFAEKYGRAPSATAQQLERSILGHELGLNGYTTVRQAAALSATLEGGPEARLLDIGSAYGWPGCYVARSLGCHVVLTDIPQDALRRAESNARVQGLAEHAHVSAADARQLPFRSHSFDAVVHADVLC